jgi:hypothetical protein
MSVQYNASTVTNGLVLCLDAANTKSYAGTGTAWNDLSGNGNNGTLVNSPTHTPGSSAYFTFNGTNTYVNFAYVQPAQNSSSTFSWNIWVYTTINRDGDILMGCRNSSLNFTKLTTNNMEYYPTSFGGAMPLNVWQNVCIVKNGTTMSYYRNGSLISSVTAAGSQISVPFFIGGDPLPGAGVEFSSARIAQVSVYNTSLTADQISQNFNALKGRYGL